MYIPLFQRLFPKTKFPLYHNTVSPMNRGDVKVTVTVVGNAQSELRSSSGQGCLHFTMHKCPLKWHELISYEYIVGKNGFSCIIDR